MTQEQLLTEIGILHVALKQALVEKAQLQRTIQALQKKVAEAGKDDTQSTTEVT